MSVAPVFDTQIEAADGTPLCCRIWTPDGEGPWPVLLMRQPYGRAIASTVTYAHPRWYASHGYAVVVQDVRGRGGSGGHFVGFAQEAADATTTLGWIRDQNWCNDRIGSYGFSYQGLSQLLLLDDSQLPDALAPSMAGLDERLHWASSTGCHWWALGLTWGLQLAAQACQRRGDEAGWSAIRQSLESGDSLRDGLDLLKRHDSEGMVLRWLQSDPGSPAGWRQHDPPAAIWRRPMLLIGGWHDPHLLGILDLWQRAIAAGGEPLLRVGAWSHLQWNGGIDRLQLAFFNRHLRHQQSSQLDENQPVWLEDLARGQWLPRWPEHGSAQAWCLTSDGLAAVDSDEGQLKTEGDSHGRLTLVHDPWRPLPGRGGHLGLDPGLSDRRDLDQRCDVACFTSAELATPMELLGQPELKLEAAADQPGFDLCAALSVLTIDGRVQQCSTGISRWLGEGCQAMAPRTVQFQPLLLTLQPGERLRLSIGLAAWPQIAVNPGDGSIPLGPAGPQHRVITVAMELANAQLRIKPMVGAN